MRRLAALPLAFLLLTALVAPAPADLAIEGPTRVAPYKMVRLQAKGYADKSAVLWRWDKKKLDGGRSGDKLWLTGPPGEYVVECMAIRLDDKGQTVVEEAEVTVTIGEPVPPKPPEPPPTPKPPAPPPNPAPIAGDGVKVMIVYESEKTREMPAAQQLILYSSGFRKYLDGVCADDPQTGTKKAWWIIDQNADASSLAKPWQDALKRQRSSVPWLLISNGKTGWEGPLPANVDDATALVKKYAEAK